MLTHKQRTEWLAAQKAEKGHWIELWSKDIQQRRSLMDHEAQKADFIFNQMTSQFGIRPKKDWTNLSVLDVGCGPASIVARSKFGKTRRGVDPLKYPDWVYKTYKNNQFEVFMQPFEELKTTKKFDVIIFYNALQHFADLAVVASKCQDVLTKDGVVYLSEYLEVPTNEAHIQFLEAPLLDSLFEGADFIVESVQQPVRLPGLVELPDGRPIDLYVARLSRSM